MASVFSRIISGEIPAYTIAESTKFISFLDIQPLQKGHALVVPKTEIDYIFNIEDELLGEMMIFSKEVARKIKSSFPCNRVGVVVIGLEVPHAHIHLIPINSEGDMNFRSPRLKLGKQELETICELLRKA